METLVNKDILFAGMVTQSAQKTSKNGAFFGVFSLEDFTGNIEMRLFSENYLRLKHLLVVGNILFIKVRVESSRYDENKLNINITQMMLLEDAMNKIIKKLILILKPLDINDKLIDGLSGMAAEFPGETELYISLKQEDKKRAMVLRSKASRVDARLFLNNINRLGPVEYQLRR